MTAEEFAAGYLVKDGLAAEKTEEKSLLDDRVSSLVEEDAGRSGTKPSQQKPWHEAASGPRCAD